MFEAVVVDALRTPIGKHAGALAAVRPDDLLAHVFAALMQRTGIDPDSVDEVIAGCANQAGEDNRNVARMAWLLAGFSYAVPAVTVNRLCASGLEAVIQGRRAIAVGDCETVLVGGVESMSRAPWVMAKAERAYGGGNQTAYDSALGWRFENPRLAARLPLEAMGETAENIAERYSIRREAQDAYAIESHRRAVAAWVAGHFSAELVPVDVAAKRGTTQVTQDEGPRGDSSLAQLAALKPVFRAGGTVTAGNSSSLNDGAAALLLMRRERAVALGLKPLAGIVASGSAGVDPRVMGMGPVPATGRALQRANLRVADLARIELNEAFAVQALAVMRELQLPVEITNVNGGAIALGHPLGCSGARILTTLVHELRRVGGGYGLASLCVGVGQGCSVIVRSE